jgi:hypothetical protein
MQKDQNFLKRIKNKFNPAMAMTGMLQSLLPQLGDTLAKMEKPESEGGMLKEGQDKIAFVVVQVNGEPMISICGLTRQGDQMIMGKPINSQPLEQMLNQNQDNGEGRN